MENIDNKYNFEQFLRDGIEDFKMIPARKIWYGIYNQMHPDRKWPSMAVCLLILSAIMFVGVSNNNNLSAAAQQKLAAVPQPKIANNDVAINENTNINTIDIAYAIANNTVTVFARNNVTTIATSNEKNGSAATKNVAKNIVAPFTSNYVITNNNQNNKQHITATATTINITNSTASENSPSTKNAITTVSDFALSPKNEVANNKISQQIEELNVPKNTSIFINKITPTINNIVSPLATIEQIKNITEQEIDNLTTAKKTTPSLKITTPTNPIETNNTITKEDITQKNEYATTHKTAQSKLKENGSLQYYITPSYGYRLMNEVTATKLNINQQDNNLLKDIPALNLEIGAVLQYKLRKNISLKTGVQVNYTNYVSKVIDLGHTTQTNLAVTNVNSYSSSARSSTYASKEGNDNLNKTTLQLAIPIGADITILGNDKLRWSIGATMQPTYLLDGTAFVLSADNKNYITEKALLRRFNINTAIETFVSIKMRNNVILNVGPQFRYQLFSTYKSIYNYSEKLYNVGLKIGVTTSF